MMRVFSVLCLVYYCSLVLADIDVDGFNTVFEDLHNRHQGYALYLADNPGALKDNTDKSTVKKLEKSESILARDTYNALLIQNHRVFKALKRADADISSALDDLSQNRAQDHLTVFISSKKEAKEKKGDEPEEKKSEEESTTGNLLVPRTITIPELYEDNELCQQIGSTVAKMFHVKKVDTIRVFTTDQARDTYVAAEGEDKDKELEATVKERIGLIQKYAQSPLFRDVYFYEEAETTALLDDMAYDLNFLKDLKKFNRAAYATQLNDLLRVLNHHEAAKEKDTADKDKKEKAEKAEKGEKKVTCVQKICAEVFYRNLFGRVVQYVGSPFYENAGGYMAECISIDNSIEEEEKKDEKEETE